ncbi:hypothetical protein [Haladaptatus salinisoli]|uniref:hypothetical protein n=1 Tax=Haladaptatus salinisoli TaxID=2884876 RepID=UPI001D0BA72E|nr:hypothetical protein [Haladaptatus salinisoli]
MSSKGILHGVDLGRQCVVCEGEFDGFVLRYPAEGGDLVLEIHGHDGMTAVEIGKEGVDGLTEAAAELNMAVDTP